MTTLINPCFLMLAREGGTSAAATLQSNRGWRWQPGDGPQGMQAQDSVVRAGRDKLPAPPGVR